MSLASSPIGVGVSIGWRAPHSALEIILGQAAFERCFAVFLNEAEIIKSYLL